MYRKDFVNNCIVAVLMIGVVAGTMVTVRLCLGAPGSQATAKSTGLSQVGTIENFEQVERLLREHARAIDVIHRQLLGDIDTINRDTIPGVIEDIAQAVDFDVPLMKDIAFTAPGGVPTWSTGTVSFGGENYTIIPGAAPNNSHVAVYWPGADNTHFGTTDSPTAVAGRWYMAFKPAGAGTTIYQALQSTIVHGGLLQASTVTANAFVVNAAATNINDSGSTTKILPGKVRVSSGTSTTLDSWGTDSGGTTYIDGGDIYTGSVTTNQLNFTPVKSTDVIAKINASAEGIDIEADNIAIGGSTTFTGTDSLTGGKFDTASSGARVRIFPSANIGFQAIDSAGSTVFEVDVGGTNQGDVMIGNYAGNKGCKWDDSSGTFDVRGTLNASDISTGTLTVNGSTLNVGTGNISLAGGLITVESSGSSAHFGSVSSYSSAYSPDIIMQANGVGFLRQSFTNDANYYTYLGHMFPSITSECFDGLIISSAVNEGFIKSVIGRVSKYSTNFNGVASQEFCLGGASVQNKVTPDSGYSNTFYPAIFSVPTADTLTVGGVGTNMNGVDIYIGSTTKRAKIDWGDGNALSVDASCIDSGTIDAARIPTSQKHTVGTYTVSGTISSTWTDLYDFGFNACYAVIKCSSTTSYMSAFAYTSDGTVRAADDQNGSDQTADLRIWGTKLQAYSNQNEFSRNGSTYIVIGFGR